MFSLDHLHPMLVHFPIALVIFGFFADLLFLKFKNEIWLSKTGSFLLILGTIASVITLLSGAFFTSEMSGAAGEIKEKHELLAWATVICLVATSAFRLFLIVRKKESGSLRLVAFALYGMAVIFVSLTGFYGGTLVYNYMMPI